jgi:phage-related tail protein
MDKPTTIEADLSKAREALKLLQDELPQYHALLTDNEQDAQRLRAERASLDGQAQARNRVMVAKELLEQHQSDIQNARAEVDRLEVLAARERTLQEMAEYAKEAKRQRQVLESALEAANAAILKHVEKIDGLWGEIARARTGFLDAGGQLTPIFNVTRFPVHWDPEKARVEDAAGRAILSELEARGIDLNDVLMPVGDARRESVFDKLHPREVVQPKPFGVMVYQLIQVFRRHKYGRDA